jgi:glucosamine-6-phosphate deaminase
MNDVTLNFMNTVKGSLLEGFYPAGWDFDKIDKCCAMSFDSLVSRGEHWDDQFEPMPVEDVGALDELMGDAIADQIEQAAASGIQLAIILPVGPMGMYKQVVNRIVASKINCSHVTTFNMDEWSDATGNTFPGDQPGGFEHAMGEALFDKLGEFTVPVSQRNFATKENLPTYAAKIQAIKVAGGKLVTVYGIGRACHIAFWEPQIAGEFEDADSWKKQTHRIGQALHPLTIEQNAITSFSSRFTLIPCFANTIGPGLFLQSDYCIGGADGAYPDRGAMWQGMSLCVTLKYCPDPWIPSSWMPTLPGKLFFMTQLSGSLEPDAH